MPGNVIESVDVDTHKIAYETRVRTLAFFLSSIANQSVEAWIAFARDKKPGTAAINLGMSGVMLLLSIPLIRAVYQNQFAVQRPIIATAFFDTATILFCLLFTQNTLSSAGDGYYSDAKIEGFFAAAGLLGYCGVRAVKYLNPEIKTTTALSDVIISKVGVARLPASAGGLCGQGAGLTTFALLAYFRGSYGTFATELFVASLNFFMALKVISDFIKQKTETQHFSFVSFVIYFMLTTGLSFEVDAAVSRLNKFSDKQCLIEGIVGAAALTMSGLLFGVKRMIDRNTNSEAVNEINASLMA